MKSCNCITMITGLQETGSILAVAPPQALLPFPSFLLPLMLPAHGHS